VAAEDPIITTRSKQELARTNRFGWHPRWWARIHSTCVGPVGPTCSRPRRFGLFPSLLPPSSCSDGLKHRVVEDEPPRSPRHPCHHRGSGPVVFAAAGRRDSRSRRSQLRSRTPPQTGPPHEHRASARWHQSRSRRAEPMKMTRNDRNPLVRFFM